ncbi:MAG TPA: response regulator [Syntrophales bacterium]|nr:response regulator [Syntrophales bacterium]HOL60124.1 response regulator [Syntrophales bacterium]HPO36205.1 response regulator [Syntrophales bacterium]
MKDKILIVDDEQTVRETMREALDNGTYEIFLAEGAEDALSIVEKEDLACVFLDLKLFGTNGIELCRTIRQMRPLSILYAMTGWSGLFEIEECREAGFDDYFPKPLTLDVIFKAVDEAIDKRKRWKSVRSAF